MLKVVGSEGQRGSQVVLGQLRIVLQDIRKRMPCSQLRRTSSTVMRVPLMHGFPIMTAGSMEMRAFAMTKR